MIGLFFVLMLQKVTLFQKYGEIFKLDVTLTAKLLILRYLT